jgi:hypothetical protein
MGYTHRYSYCTTAAAFQHAWPQMVADARRIVERVEAAGVVLRQPGDESPPVTDECILVNGEAAEELDGEPLVIRRTTGGMQPAGCDRTGNVRTFCKTHRFPYDLAVCAILLRCHRLAPEAFSIDSDGDWDDEWADGAQGPRVKGLSARGLVSELFGEIPAASPFTVV